MTGNAAIMRDANLGKFKPLARLTSSSMCWQPAHIHSNKRTGAAIRRAQAKSE